MRVKRRRKLPRAHHVVWNHVPQQIEPKQRKLRQYPPLVRNRRRQNHVECRQPVRSDNQQLVARGRRNARELSFPNHAHCCTEGHGRVSPARVQGILAQRNVKSITLAVEKNISAGEEKEITAIKRTVWTIVETLVADRV